MGILFAFISGLIFSLGLVISGMANPAKVQNFLDPFGLWDPSLAFVMIGAIAVGSVGFRLLKLRRQPLFAERFSLTARTDIDRPLVIGAAFFGIGWGLAGYCPGPALTALPLAATGTLVFVVAMLAGMALAKIVQRRLANAETPAVR